MDKIEQIREFISRLAQLTTEEIATARALIGDAFDEIDALPTTAENVALLNELADAGEAVMGRDAEIEAEAAQAEADKEAARARRAKLNGETEDETSDEAEPVATDEAPADAEGAEQPEAVAASGSRPAGTSISNMARSGRTAEPAPEVGNSAGGALIAAGGLGAHRSGDVIADRYELAEGMSHTLKRMKKTDRPVGDVLVASAEWQYPEDRRLDSGIEESMSTADAKKMDAVCHPTALVATGGICAPVNVDWSLDTWAVADRPIRDGLPAFQATRGGLTFRTPPAFSALAAATGIWTAATDANPSGATKALEIISCPSSTTTLVDAVSTRLGFGNMMGQFDPETIAANTDLAIAAAARKAEVNLLTKIAAASTLDVTTAAVVGASRDFLTSLDVATAVYRNVNRLSDSQVLTIILPRWVKSLIRGDRARELAHDGQSVDPLAIPDAWIEDTIALRGVKPIWTLESLPVNGAVYPAQDFSGFTATSAIPAFPTKLVWHMFVEGSIQFLDAGRLDLGVVRDSTLDATNDYETFVETFEGIANRGFAGSCVQFVSALAGTGATAAAVTVGTPL